MDPKELAQYLTEDPDLFNEGRRTKDVLSGLTRELMKQIFPALIKYYEDHANMSSNLWSTSDVHEVDRRRIYKAVQNPIAKTTLARLKYFGFQPSQKFKALWDPNFRTIVINPLAYSNKAPRRESLDLIRQQVDNTIRHELEHTHQSVETDDQAFQNYVASDQDVAGYLAQSSEIEAFAAEIARDYDKVDIDPEMAIQGRLRHLKDHERYEEIKDALTKEVNKRIAIIKRRGRSKRKRKEEQREIRRNEMQQRKKARGQISKDQLK